MTNTITNRQLFFMLILTLTGGIVGIAKSMAATVGTNAWLVIIITSLVFGLASVVIASLNTMHEGQMLFDYAPSLITRPGAYILIAYYVAYFLFVLLSLLYDLTRLLHYDFFPRTPQWAFPLVGLPVFCYVANKGITNVARLAEFVGVVFLTVGLLVHVLMAIEGRISRILPLFYPDKMSAFLSGLKASIFPFFGIEIMLVIPFLKKKKGGGKPAKAAFLSLLAVGAFYVVLVETSIMKIGIIDIINHNDALVVAIRDTSPKGLEIISRLDILYLTVGLTGLFVGISILLMTIVEYLCRLFPKAKRPLITACVGAVVYLLFLCVCGIPGYHDFYVEVGTYLCPFSAIFVPCVLLLIAKAKRRGGKAVAHGG